MLASGALQESDIDFQIQQNDVRGGRGNQLRGVLHDSRDINIRLSQIEINFEWLARQLGQTLQYKPVRAHAIPRTYQIKPIDAVWDKNMTRDEDYVLDENMSWSEDDPAIRFFDYLFGKSKWAVQDEYNPEVHLKGIVLDNKPLSKGSLIIYDKDNRLVISDDYSLRGNLIELNSDLNELYEVLTYEYMSRENSQIIEIDNTVFQKSGASLILETIEIDYNERPINKIQYQFDNVVLTGTYEINTSSQREAQSFDMNLRVLKKRRNEGIVGRIKRIPINM